MPTNNAIIAQDGNLLTIIFPTFSITIPTENAILWNGEPLPHSLNLDSCADGFEFYDIEDKFVLGYEAHRRGDLGALDAAAEIDEGNIQGPMVNRQVIDTGFSREKDQQHDRGAVIPRTPARSTNRATLFHSPPSKTPPQPAKYARSFSATASTSSAPSPRTIIPITPAEGTTHKLREPSIQTAFLTLPSSHYGFIRQRTYDADFSWAMVSGAVDDEVEGNGEFELVREGC
ncbi:MAG: hypothetical protein Q9198_010205 [Flavoplaca austrocitrina]